MDILTDNTTNIIEGFKIKSSSAEQGLWRYGRFSSAASVTTTECSLRHWNMEDSFNKAYGSLGCAIALPQYLFHKSYIF